jgi:hypothetical protein
MVKWRWLIEGAQKELQKYPHTTHTHRELLMDYAECKYTLSILLAPWRSCQRLMDGNKFVIVVLHALCWWSAQYKIEAHSQYTECSQSLLGVGRSFESKTPAN